MSSVAYLTDGRMILLAESFPSLLGRPGIAPWNADEVNRSAKQAWQTGGSIHAVRFVLSVWDPRHRWSAGAFSITQALQVWDTAHQHAFLAWARAPWWP